MSDAPVKSRLVLNFPGFEKTDTLHQIERLTYGAGETGKVWSFDLTPFDQPDIKEHHATARFKAKAGNWKTQTRLVQFSWNDIVDAYEKAPFPSGFFRNFPKFLAFFTDGTVGAYRRASGRYWGFTIYPLLLIALFLLVTGFVSYGLLSYFGMAGWLLTICATLFALTSTLLLCKWPGERLYLIMTIADWGFARDMVHRSNPDIEERFQSFAKTVIEEIEASKQDEILIVGHSFGAIWAVAALALALEQKPDLLAGKRVTFLALGSSILKVALAPSAKFLRDWWRRVMQEDRLHWHEVQTKDDLIAFYKCDPAKAARVNDIKAGYSISRVRFKDGMDKARYKSMRKSSFRTHRQYILHYNKRVHFDFLYRVFGPLWASDWAKNEKLHKAIDADGLLRYESED